MANRAHFTYKQERQIISIFEDSHRSILYSDNFENAGIVALFRVCRDYCTAMAGGKTIPRVKMTNEQKEQVRSEFIERLNKLSIRYYEQI